MNTIQISLPVGLQKKAERLVVDGYFDSFNDLTHTAINDLVEAMENNRQADEVENEYRQGKAKVFKTGEEIKKYMAKLANS